MHRTVLMCCATLAAHPLRLQHTTTYNVLRLQHTTTFNVLRLQHTPYNFKWEQLNYRKAELESLGTVKVASLARRRLVCAKSGLFRNNMGCLI